MGARRRGVAIPPRPTILQAIVWAKVATLFPQVGLEDFDMDMDNLVSSVVPAAAETPLPMDIPGEEPTVAVIAGGDEGNV
jgi:hypothetical protein